MDRKEFNTLQNIKHELGWTAIRLGITNPDAIPKMMDLLKRIQYHGDMKTHPVDYTQYAKDAQAVLKEAGIDV